MERKLAAILSADVQGYIVLLIDLWISIAVHASTSPSGLRSTRTGSITLSGAKSKGPHVQFPHLKKDSYSRLMGDDEEATIRTLTAYREVMMNLIQQHRGRVVDSPGDNLLAEFGSAVDAVQGAVAVQTELKTRNAELPDHRQMRYRIGINVGDVVGEGERIYGDGVNIAARIESLAEGGGISVSANVHEQVKNKLDLAFTDQGEQAVKNIADPVRVYRVLLNGDASVSPRQEGQTESVVALPLPDKPSIAVLPFTNLSKDPEQEYFSDGMTDDIITDLSKISGLFVIARNSVFAYKGQTVNIPEVGRALGVSHVLESSVRKADNQIRINVQLIEAATSRHVWAERYDRELKDIFALQDEMTQKIVRALEIKLTTQEQAQVRLIPTGNLEAYDYLLRGRRQLWQFTKTSNRHTRQLLEHALALDPEYAAAAAFLGFNYFWEWVFWHPSPKVLERAFALAQRAVSLDDMLPEAHTILGIVYWFKKQHEQAIAAVERALALDSNYADGYAFLGFILSTTGKPEEGLRLSQQAFRLNPNPSHIYYSSLGMAYYIMRRNEEFIPIAKRLIALNPTDAAAHAFLACVCIELGRKEEARTEFIEGLKLSPLGLPQNLMQQIPFSDKAELQRLIGNARKALATLRMSDYVSIVKYRVTQYFQERRTRDKALS